MNMDGQTQQSYKAFLNHTQSHTLCYNIKLLYMNILFPIVITHTFSMILRAALSGLKIHAVGCKKLVLALEKYI